MPSRTGTAVDHVPASSGGPPRRSAWGPYRDRSVARAADRESDIAPHWKRPPPTGTESRSAEAGRQCSEQMFDSQARREGHLTDGFDCAENRRDMEAEAPNANQHSAWRATLGLGVVAGLVAVAGLATALGHHSRTTPPPSPAPTPSLVVPPGLMTGLGFS